MVSKSFKKSRIICYHSAIVSKRGKPEAFVYEHILKYNENIFLKGIDSFIYMRYNNFADICGL